jgi:hypothetical protein
MKQRQAMLAAVVMSAVSLSACANNSDDSATTGGAQGAAALSDRSAQSEDRIAGPEAAGRSAHSGGILQGTAIQQYVISHASLTIRSTHVGQAMVRADGIATGAGGFVASENTQADRKGRARTSTLVFRVPSSSFDATLDALKQLGHLENESTESQDVTADVVGVQSRVASAKATIRRIRVLLTRAQDLGDVIKLESELSTRQSNLEAVEARLNYLRDQAAMSTINLTLVSPTVAPASKPDDNGFVAGLRSGWDALVSVLVALATVAGALLPFLGVAVLLGIPTWLAVRGINRRRHIETPTPPTTAGS